MSSGKIALIYRYVPLKQAAQGKREAGVFVVEESFFNPFVQKKIEASAFVKKYFEPVIPMMK